MESSRRRRVAWAKSRDAQRVVAPNGVATGGGTVVYTSIMLDWTQCSAVERTPGKVSNEWVCRATRVPVRALFESVEGGAAWSRASWPPLPGRSGWRGRPANGGRIL